MTHISEEDLILHYYGEDAVTGSDPANVDRHLSDCPSCRANYSALQLVLNTVDSAPVPERGPGYGAEVWKRIERKIPRRRRWPWLLQQRWWILAPTVAMMLALAFFAGRVSQRNDKAVAGSQVRERILMVAVGDHLDRSQIVLAELSNAPEGQGKSDISGEKQLAEELLDDNRLYRQTARSTGDTAVASVLDDLERVLLEIAHSPSQVSSQQLDQLREEIQSRGLMFKVRVVGSQVRQREIAPVKIGGKEEKRL